MPSSPLRPAVFLDRDGTVIHDAHYLADPEGVRLLPGAAEAVARLNRAGVPVVLVTNQSGIGRGLFSEADFRAVQDRVEALLAAGGARIDAVYHCPHAPDADPPCDCRKP
ncbi:MAG TPA: HAD-IIIA family hydrolase, partial [Longimicrobiaceae bacterium]